MNKTKKKFPIFFVIFTLLYLFIEITFRTDLLNVVSTLKDIVEIESIEVVGRFIASIGFVIFIFSNFRIHIESLKKWNILLKTIIYPIVFFVAFQSFYIFQEKLITYIAENMTVSEKKDAMKLSLEKESLYFGKLKIEEYPYTQENKKNSESKIFLALYPLLNKDNKVKLDSLENQKKALVANSVMGRWSQSENINEMIAKESEILNYIFFGFKNLNPNKTRNFLSAGRGEAYDYVLANYRNQYAQAAMNYKSKEKGYRESAQSLYFHHDKLLSKSDFEEKIVTDFSKAIGDIKSNKIKSEHTKANAVEYFSNKIFYYQGHEMGASTPYYMYKYIDMRAFALAAERKENLLFSDVFNGLRFNFSNCNATVSNEKGVFINGKNTNRELSEAQFNFIYNEIFEKENANKNRINCRYTYENYKKTKQEMHNLFTIYNSGFYIDNVNKYDITPEFVNQNYLFRKVAMYILEFFIEENTGKYLIEILNYDFDKYKRLERALNFSSKEKFIASINKFGADEFTKKYMEKTKELGLNLEFLKGYKNHRRYFYKEFYSTPQVRNEIERVFPFFVNKNGEVTKVNDIVNIDNKNIEAFKKYMIEKQYADYIEILNNPNLMANGEKHYEIGNAIAKGYIAPPLVLLISGIMIFISIINLILKISSVFIEDKKGIFKIVMTLLFILPAFIPNNYSENKYILFYKENKTLHYYSLIWLQNSEKVIELGNLDNIYIDMLYKKIYSTAINYERGIDPDNRSIEIKRNQLKRGL